MLGFTSTRLINLQSVIQDTEQSLGEVVRQIDKAVVHNDAIILVSLKTTCGASSASRLIKLCLAES